MKKSVVVVLVLLAAIVLVSPALVGRLAEQSLDKNLNWAADESDEVRVTSEQFTRGWFSSEGQHRIELQEGDLLSALRAISGPIAANDLPVLIINTRIDHGLIPLSSITRDKGSLVPGLGSAVSTLQVELADGELVDVPGTIYSKIALDGELHSNYVLAAGSLDKDGVVASWGDVDIDVTTDPASGEVVFDGTVGRLAFETDGESMTMDGLSFDGRQHPTEFGIAVGDIAFELGGFVANQGGGPAGSLSKMTVKGNSVIDDDALNVDATMSMTMGDLPQFGEMSIDMSLSIAGADAATVGRLQQRLEDAAGSADPMAVYTSVDGDLKQLFAAGFEFNFDKLDITLPEGTMHATLHFSFDERDPATFTWSSLLLSTSASVTLAIPASVVETYAQGNPQAAMAIGGGYLVRRGDDYVTEAQLKQGLLTINGAPIPLPVGAM